MPHYALLSVSDKTGIPEFARGLVGFGLSILSTGGTAKALEAENIPHTLVEEFTGFPEMFDGRLKTIHPMVHGGILYIRGNTEHEAAALKHSIEPVDFVVVNFYPFERTLQKPGVQQAEVIENIDIGGPGMVRSAAKNHASVTVVVSPNDYEEVLTTMRENGGKTTLALRTRLARTAFEATTRYDMFIAGWLAEQEMVGTDGGHAGKIRPKREVAPLLVLSRTLANR